MPPERWSSLPRLVLDAGLHPANGLGKVDGSVARGSTNVVLVIVSYGVEAFGFTHIPDLLFM